MKNKPLDSVLEVAKRVISGQQDTVAIPNNEAYKFDPNDPLGMRKKNDELAKQRLAKGVPTKSGTGIKKVKDGVTTHTRTKFASDEPTERKKYGTSQKRVRKIKESVGKTAGDHSYYYLQRAKQLAQKAGHNYDNLPQYDRTHNNHKDYFDNKAKNESVEIQEKHMKDMKKNEELKGNQHKIDANKNGKIDAEDFKMLRKKKNESFIEKLKSLKENNLKFVADIFNEDSDSEQFKKELETAQKVASTKKTKEQEANTAKGFVQAVKNVDDIKEETLDEATPSKKQVKMAIGIARDKRYAGGNMTGAVKTMDKINKGLAQHPKVADELRKQNEETEQLDEVSRKHFQQVADLIKGHDSQDKRNELAKHHAGIFAKQNPRFNHKIFYKAAGADIMHKEEVNERKMTDDEKDKAEDIVKGMKKNLKGFKDRYGADAKKVMYATANKNAMKGDTDEEN